MDYRQVLAGAAAGVTVAAGIFISANLFSRVDDMYRYNDLLASGYEPGAAIRIIQDRRNRESVLWRKLTFLRDLK